MRKFAMLWLAAACLTPAWGATLSLLSLNDLISKSSMIVRGQVTAASASFTGTVIYTHYKVTIAAQWKGAAQSTVDVLVPGGTAKGVRQICPGAPQLTVGQQYVLFLWTSRFGLNYTMGFTQGVFNLLGTAGNLSAVQMPATETILAPGTGQAVQNPPISLPLAQLISAITAGGGN